MILAQRVNVERNQLFADSEAGSQKAGFTRERKGCSGLLLQSQFKLCVLTTKKLQQKMLPCKTVVLVGIQKQAGFNSLAKGNTSFDSVEYRLLCYVFSILLFTYIFSGAN